MKMTSSIVRAVCLLGMLIPLGCVSNVANPSFNASTAEARAAIRQMREDPKPLPRPLVIIGGFLDPNVSPPLFANFFASVTTRDAKIIPVSIGLCGSFEECRRVILAAVDQACPSDNPQWTTEVDVVGASLGGLAARYAAAPSIDSVKPQRLRIARLFTISSPHRGATLAKAVGFTAFHNDMRPGSPFLSRLAQFDGSAGYAVYPYVHLHDEIVGEQYAAPSCQTPWWLADSGGLPPHSAAMLDVRIHADIARRLRGETPFSTWPPTELPQP